MNIQKAALVVSLFVCAAASSAPAQRSDYYVVTLADRAAEEAGGVDRALDRLERQLTRRGAAIVTRFEHVLRGFAVHAPDPATAPGLAELPEVARVERLGGAAPSAQQLNPPNWGLDRIDQVNLPLNHSYTYATTGNGVHLFVVDTGVAFAHPEFQGRTPRGWDSWDALEDIPNEITNDPESFDSDCHITRTGPPYVYTLTGHGTQVAAIAAGATVGVAKGATLHSIKISSCDYFQNNRQPYDFPDTGPQPATLVAALAAFEYIATSPHLRPAVVNYSWNKTGTDSYPAAFVTAVENLIDSGVTFVWSAGNEEGVTGVPVGAAISVGASTNGDRRVHGTCYGADLYAPGSDITTASPRGGYTSFSYTSAAAPHVAGAAARFLSSQPSASPAQVKSFILNTATPNKVGNVPYWGYSKSLLYMPPGQ